MVGPESFFIEEAIRLLADQLLKPETKMLDHEVVAGGEARPEAVLARAATPPFGSSRRLIVVRNIERMRLQDLETFLPYLETPVPSCCLVFTAAVMPAHPRFNAALRRRDAVVPCEVLAEAKRPAWLKHQLQRLDPRLTLSDDAAEMLAELDQDLTRLKNELEKLAAYVGGRKAGIETDDLRAVVGRGPVASVFEFPQAVVNRERVPALRFLHRLLDEGVPPPKIFYHLHQHYRRLWRDGAVSASSNEMPCEVFRFLLEADLAIKNSRRPDVVLESLILRLVGVWRD